LVWFMVTIQFLAWLQFNSGPTNKLYLAAMELLKPDMNVLV